MTGFTFNVHATDGTARTGLIRTVRGEIRTPAFMPVGTAGTVKAMLPESVRETGADIVLGNTYQLHLGQLFEQPADGSAVRVGVIGDDHPNEFGGGGRMRRCIFHCGFAFQLVGQHRPPREKTEH